MDKAQTVRLLNLVDYVTNSIVSHSVLENSQGGMTAFAFDEGQRLSEHTAPFDAIVQVLDGEAEIIIAGTPHQMKCGDLIIMPANIPHAVKATKRFKMLLTMIKGQAI